MKGWQKSIAVLVLMVAVVEGLDFAMTSAPVPEPAERFIGYFEALSEESDTGLLDRVLFSYIMARGRL